MEWDRIRMAQQYLQKANGIRTEAGDCDYDEKRALQDLFDECYVASFSREKLVDLLAASCQGNFKIPEDVDAERYRKAYVREASVMLNELKKM
jgi:hypothetical protein